MKSNHDLIKNYGWTLWMNSIHWKMVYNVCIHHNRNLSLGLVTHETKALNVTIGFHMNKVVFNVISSLRNLVIIGLFWLALHNPRVDWHTKSLHIETPQHETLDYETLVKNMQNVKQKEDFNGTRRPRCPKPLFVWIKTFIKVAKKRNAFLI